MGYASNSHATLNDRAEIQRMLRAPFTEQLFKNYKNKLINYLQRYLSKIIFNLKKIIKLIFIAQ